METLQKQSGQLQSRYEHENSQIGPTKQAASECCHDAETEHDMSFFFSFFLPFFVFAYLTNFIIQSITKSFPQSSSQNSCRDRYGSFDEQRLFSVKFARFRNFFDFAQI